MRRLLLLLVLALAGGVVFLSVALSQLHQSPWDKTPSQLKACGRTYVLPAPQGVSRSVVEDQRLTVQDHVWTWQGKRSVWGTKQSGSCGTNVYLQVGGNEFHSYNLSGTP
jgi:hypothetical protein